VNQLDYQKQIIREEYVFPEVNDRKKRKDSYVNRSAVSRKTKILSSLSNYRRGIHGKH